MASKFSTTVALFLAVNLLFFTLTTANYCPPKHPKPKPKYKPKPTPKPIMKPPPMPYYPPKTKPPPMPYYPPSYYCKCPIDTLKLGVCANVLNGLLSAVVGEPYTGSCCTLLHGLADLEAAVCLCTAIKANILGINLDVPVSLSLLVNHCGHMIPEGFVCP